MGDSMREKKKIPKIIIVNTFINTDKEKMKIELNKKIEKILQKAGKLI